jgi:DNA-directed RNA polymerase specialized sigma24 family protein
MSVTPMQLRPSLNGKTSVGDEAKPELFVQLVRRVARADRPAFASLYDTLSPRVSVQIQQTLPDRVDAAAICRATFVEVWWLARFHVALGTDVLAWIAGIAARRGAERLRAAEFHREADELNHGADTDRGRRRVAANAIADRSAELALKSLLDPGTDPVSRPPLIPRQASIRPREPGTVR